MRSAIKYVICAGLLAGCTREMFDDGATDILVQNPLCMLFCSTSFSGADTDTGTGSSNVSQSTTAGGIN